MFFIQTRLIFWFYLLISNPSTLLQVLTHNEEELSLTENMKNPNPREEKRAKSPQRESKVITDEGHSTENRDLGQSWAFVLSHFTPWRLNHELSKTINVYTYVF